MSTYAIINTTTNTVEGMTLWDGVSEWSPGDGFIAVESTTVGVGIGWTYAGGVFSEPPVVAPTAAEILAANQLTQASLLAQASQAMAPVLVSLQLGDATTAETATAKAWQTYYRALQAIDLTVESPTWPTIPS